MDGKTIEQARKAAGINQETLAASLGLMHRGTLTDIESNAVKVDQGWIIYALGVIAGIAKHKTEHIA